MIEGYGTARGRPQGHVISIWPHRRPLLLGLTTLACPSSSIASRILLLGDRCLLPLRKPSTRSGVAVDGGGDVVGLADDCAGGDSGKGEGVGSIDLRSCVNSSCIRLSLSSSSSCVGGVVPTTIRELRKLRPLSFTAQADSYASCSTS